MVRKLVAISESQNAIIFFYKINIEKSHLFNNNQFLTSLISIFYDATALSDHTNLSDHAPLSDHTGGPDLAVLFYKVIDNQYIIGKNTRE